MIVPTFPVPKAYVKLSIALALVAGLLLTLFGLSRLPWPQSIGWSDTNALLRFLGFLVLALLLAVASWHLIEKKALKLKNSTDIYIDCATNRVFKREAR